MNGKLTKKTMITVLFVSCLYMIRCGLVVRIPGFHPGGPGSIPGIGTSFLIHFSFPGELIKFI